MLNLNTLSPRHNPHHLWFRFIFLYENCCLFSTSLKFLLGGPIKDKSALVQIMAWHRTDNKSSFELMVVWFIDVYMRPRPRWVTNLKHIFSSHIIPIPALTRCRYLRSNPKNGNVISIHISNNMAADDLATTESKASECMELPKPGYILPGGRSMKTSQIPMFLHIAARVWGQHWHT